MLEEGLCRFHMPVITGICRKTVILNSFVEQSHTKNNDKI